MTKLKNYMKQLTAAFAAGIFTCGSFTAVCSMQVLAAAEQEEENSTEAVSSDDLLREDYYEYVNKDLLDSVVIDPTESEWSQFSLVSDSVSDELSDVLRDVVDNRDQYEQGSSEQKIADYYLSYLDWETRNSAGLGPLQQYVDAFLQADTIQEYIEVAASLIGEVGEDSIISAGITYDSFDSTQYIAVVDSMDLGLDKETYEDEAYDDLMPDYEAFIAAVLREAGYGDEAESYASEILSFCREMSDYDLDLQDYYDVELTYNPYTAEELDELYSNIDMNAFLSTAGYDKWDTYLVQNVELSEAVNEKLIEENLDLLKAYSIYCLVSDFAIYLSADLDQAYISFENKFSGIMEQETDEKRAAENTQGMFPWEFSQIYVAENFSEEEKNDVTEMIEAFIDHYRERIYELDWMEEETKEAAVRKLDTMVIQIGYPDEWPDYNAEVEILGPEDGGFLIDNVFKLLKASYQYNVEKDSGEVDRDAWSWTPTTINACYIPSLNTINFPAAILQEPFYDPDATDAQNYGAIGMVIAHEITHAFDSNGSQYDEYGNYDPWWTEADAEKFEELTQEVADYYDTFTVDGLQVNGSLTLTENIADLGAINTITSFFEDDPEQLDELFRSFAALWAAKYTDETLHALIDTDVHSPNQVRVNATIRTVDCFYETYPEIQEGDAMYLAPEDRVRIW